MEISDSIVLTGDGRIPNSDLSLVIYRQAIRSDVPTLENDLRKNGWIPEWHSSLGLYPAQHFHSDAHELIAVTRGSILGEFGGPTGVRRVLSAGDIVVIPAGVGHFGIEFSEDLRLTGAFPIGCSIHDFRLGYVSEYDQVFRSARSVPLPAFDPLQGARGPLINVWNKCRSGG
jgi:uncharacterized protein YjlB